MSAEYLNELKIHWEFTKKESRYSLRFYGITKDLETEEFMMILDVAQKGNLRSFLSRYSHKDFHSGNILRFGKEIKTMFEEADKEIPNISTLHKKNCDAIYTSRLFAFDNLTKPVNSSIITSYLDDDENNEDNQDSQLVDLEVSSSLLQSKDDINNENSFDK
ncbi:unnamed protein product [Rhizophagus irregularis]|uniref:Uncharacterized protein n=1 Tax=Rhizophagus irregularis TaxID=588596 RepID=A0A915YW27_9GLOM|nr:unnamed protein product [Rhizophagus irregularis]